MRKREFETAAERQKAYRNRKRGDEGSNVTPTNSNVTRNVTEGDENVTIQPNVTLNGGDRLFEDARPGYYIYDVAVYERKCWGCGEGFETRLEMNKFCSPACKEEFLDEATSAGGMKRAGGEILSRWRFSVGAGTDQVT